MASTDAKAFPIKNQAYRVTFSLLDADGDLVTGATGLDSEVSKDAGTFADCTNEATEIATASGVYYLDLTSTEMNADTVAVIVKTTSSGAKTTTLVFYPLEDADIRVNAVMWAGTANTTSDIAIKTTLAKTTHITGFNDLSAAQVNTECDTALADVGVTTTVTGRIDVAVSSRAAPGAAMTLTAAYDAAKVASSQTSVDTVATYIDTEVGAIKAKTDQMVFTTANRVDASATMSLAAGDLTSIADAILKRDWTGVSGEAAYSLLNAARMLRNVWNTTGGTLTVKKEDGTTSAWTRTLSVDPTAEPIVGAT